MAVLYCDSFAYGDPSDADPKRWHAARVDPSGGLTVMTTGSRYYSDRWLKLTGGAGGGYSYGFSYVYTAIAGVPQTVVAMYGYKAIQYAHYLSGYTGRIPGIAFLDNGTEQCHIYENGGSLVARRGTTVLGTATSPTRGLDVWQQFEIKVKISSTNGTIEVWQDGDKTMDLTGLNNRQTSENRVNGVMWGYVHQNDLGGTFGTGGMHYHIHGISDVVIMDTTGTYCNDRLGPRRVERIYPTGVGNYTQWTSSTTYSNWQNVDETTPDAADYNYTSTLTSIDTFVMSDLTNVATTISACVPVAWIKTKDGGAAYIQGAARSSSVDGFSSTLTVPSGEDYVAGPIYVDPNTGVAWTGTAVNASEFGYKLVG